MKSAADVVTSIGAERLRKAPLLKLNPSDLVHFLTNAKVFSQLKRQEASVLFITKALKPRKSKNVPNPNEWTEHSDHSRFRGMLVPTLTRLHITRTSEGRFDWAPNGTLCRKVPQEDLLAYIGFLAWDLVRARLVWPEPAIAAAKEEGKTPRTGRSGAIEKAWRIGQFLVNHDETRVRLAETSLGAQVAYWTKETGDIRRYLKRAAEAAFSNRNVLSADGLRESVMVSLLKDGFTTTSFSADVMLADFFFDRPNYMPMRASTITLETMFIGGRPFSSFRRLS